MGLNVASLRLLSTRPRRAAAIACVGPFLFATGLAVDQLGFFASIPPPPTITVLEYSLVAVELVVLATAIRLYRANRA